MKIAFFDAKEYDKREFDKQNKGWEIEYYETKLRPQTAHLAHGCEAVCAFVNDRIDGDTIGVLKKEGVKLLAMRCAGYNNVDLAAAKEARIKVVRVPAYSPHAVAEHAMAMLLTLNRKIHRAYIRTRDFNFSLSGLEGFVLHGKTAGVIGTGKIGGAFVDICQGFGMKILCYDPYPTGGYRYVPLPQLFEESDVISLHCPLTPETRHIVNERSIRKMKKGAFLINTSRGGLIESEALLSGLAGGKLGGACLDVYEEEANYFYEDNSQQGMADEKLALLISRPNVILTSHQAYFTREALSEIAAATLENIRLFFEEKRTPNEVSCAK